MVAPDDFKNEYSPDGVAQATGQPMTVFGLHLLVWAPGKKNSAQMSWECKNNGPVCNFGSINFVFFSSISLLSSPNYPAAAIFAHKWQIRHKQRGYVLAVGVKVCIGVNQTSL